MLAATLRGVIAQVDEVRLPLHILLEARFGELNENQEELLVAARAGADHIDAAIRRVGVVADADRDALVVRPEPVSLNDVVRAVLPMVRATADRHSARVDLQLEPALPRVWANRAALAEAVALVATLAAERLAEGGALTITTASTAESCSARIAPADASLLDAPLVIAAQRVLQVQSATAQVVGGSLEIILPRALPAPHAKTD
jgi:signal transduction histidine kinase